MDGSEIRGSSNASVLVKYGTYTGLAKFTVWMPEFQLEVTVGDTRLSQIKGWKVPEEHATGAKSKRSLNVTRTDGAAAGIPTVVSSSSESAVTARAKKRSAFEPEDSIEDTSMDVDDPDIILEEDEQEERFRGNDHGWNTINSIDRNPPANCRLRFQQSPVEVHARFLATDHDSGRVSYFVNRRTWLRVTDLVAGMLRVSDPRIATLLQGRIVQGRGQGRTEVQVLSPLTGRVIGAKEVRVGNDRVSVTRLSVRVVSGLQLSISPDTAIENGYVAETSVTRRLTAQYQVRTLAVKILEDKHEMNIYFISICIFNLVWDFQVQFLFVLMSISSRVVHFIKCLFSLVNTQISYTLRDRQTRKRLLVDKLISLTYIR